MTAYEGQIAPDEAFLEVITLVSDTTEKTFKSIPTETQIARITDASGNTTGYVYAPGERTVEKTIHKVYASASIQLFISGSRHPIHDRLVWSERVGRAPPMVEAVLSTIPSRKK
jgi:YD repeat-containing protein